MDKPKFKLFEINLLSCCKLLINNPVKHEKVGVCTISGISISPIGRPILTFIFKKDDACSLILLRLAPPPHKITLLIELFLNFKKLSLSFTSSNISSILGFIIAVNMALGIF